LFVCVPQDAGARFSRREILVFVSRASFGDGSGRFWQCLLGAVYAADNTIRVEAMGAEEVVSG